MSAFVNWGLASLPRYIVVFEICVALPFYLYFVVLLHGDGTLTLSWALQMIPMGAAIWGVVAVLTWFTIVQPLKKQRGR